MKRKAMLFIFCALFLTLCGCNHSSKSDLEIFIKNFNSAHPNGFKIDDGWYDLSVSTVTYDEQSGRKEILSSSFEGELEFLYETYEGRVKTAKCTSFTATFDDSDYTIPLTTEYSETYTNGAELYRLRRTTSNSLLVEEYTEGSNTMSEVTFFFRLGTEFTNMNLLPMYQTWERIYQSVEVEENVLTIVWDSNEDSNGSKRVVTDEYYFDDNYHLIKTTRVDQTHFYSNGTRTDNSYFTIKVLSRCDAKTIDVPTKYQKELEVNHKESFKL